MMIGCRAWTNTSGIAPEGTVYHVIDEEELSKNKLLTLCGESGVRVYWFVFEGEVEQVNCPKCLSLLYV